MKAISVILRLRKCAPLCYEASGTFIMQCNYLYEHKKDLLNTGKLIFVLFGALAKVEDKTGQDIASETKRDRKKAETTYPEMAEINGLFRLHSQ